MTILRLLLTLSATIVPLAWSGHVSAMEGANDDELHTMEEYDYFCVGFDYDRDTHTLSYRHQITQGPNPLRPVISEELPQPLQAAIENAAVATAHYLNIGLDEGRSLSSTLTGFVPGTSANGEIEWTRTTWGNQTLTDSRKEWRTFAAEATQFKDTWRSKPWNEKYIEFIDTYGRLSTVYTTDSLTTKDSVIRFTFFFPLSGFHTDREFSIKFDQIFGIPDWYLKNFPVEAQRDWFGREVQESL